MILRLSLDLPEDETYVHTIRLLSRCLLQDIGVKTTIISDVETIVTELCSNVVRHAKSKAGHFQITLEFFKPRIIITVTDQGLGFVQEDVLPVGTVRPDGKGGERLGGFGLSLLDGLSDKLDFTTTDPHGTTVRAEKNLYYDTQEEAVEATKLDADNGAQVTVDKG